MIRASGGFIAPRLPYHTAAEIDEAVRIHEVLPVFRALMGGLDFRPPEVRWAEEREHELRASARMWDWPRPPG